MNLKPIPKSPGTNRCCFFKLNINAYPSVRNHCRGKVKVEYCPTCRTRHLLSSKLMEALLLSSGCREISCRMSNSSVARKKGTSPGDYLCLWYGVCSWPCANTGRKFHLYIVNKSVITNYKTKIYFVMHCFSVWICI